MQLRRLQKVCRSTPCSVPSTRKGSRADLDLVTGHDVVYEELTDLTQVPQFMIDSMKTIDEFGGESSCHDTAALAALYSGCRLIPLVSRVRTGRRRQRSAAVLEPSATQLCRFRQVCRLERCLQVRDPVTRCRLSSSANTRLTDCPHISSLP